MRRITFGLVTGDFLVDGEPLPKSFQRATRLGTGFAEQLDIHELRPATVREALQFSRPATAALKEVPKEEKYAYCETIGLELLENGRISRERPSESRRGSLEGAWSSASD